jgi:site-specific DNA recombinase
LFFIGFIKLDSFAAFRISAPPQLRNGVTTVAKEDRKSVKEEIAIYARYSTGPSKSIERQAQKFASYAHSIGADETSLFSDSMGIAVERERPGLSEVLKKCERGEIDTVVVEDLDRLARSFHLTAAVINRLEKAGVRLRIASERRAAVKSVKARKALRKGEGQSTESKRTADEE